MPWKTMLAWGTGQVDDSLRHKLEFVLEENRVYRALLDRHSPPWRLQDAERKVLAEKGKPLGRLLPQVITIVQPETLLKWHRRLVAKKWDFSHRRAKPVGRPAVDAVLERLVVQLARDNPGWGYDRIVGALTNLGRQFRIRPLEIFCAARGWEQSRRGGTIPPGPNLSGVTSKCSGPRISLPPKSGRPPDWSPFTCSFSFICRRARLCWAG